MSADRGLAFSAPADVGVVGWNRIGQLRESKTDLKSQKGISDPDDGGLLNIHTFCGGGEGPVDDDGSGFDCSVSGDFTTKLVVAEGGGGGDTYTLFGLGLARLGISTKSLLRRA